MIVTETHETEGYLRAMVVLDRVAGSEMKSMTRLDWYLLGESKDLYKDLTFEIELSQMKISVLHIRAK